MNRGILYDTVERRRRGTSDLHRSTIDRVPAAFGEAGISLIVKDVAVSHRDKGILGLREDDDVHFIVVQSLRRSDPHNTGSSFRIQSSLLTIDFSYFVDWRGRVVESAMERVLRLRVVHFMKNRGHGLREISRLSRRFESERHGDVV